MDDTKMETPDSLAVDNQDYPFIDHGLVLVNGMDGKPSHWLQEVSVSIDDPVLLGNAFHYRSSWVEGDKQYCLYTRHLSLSTVRNAL